MRSSHRRYEPFGSLLSASGTGESIYGFAGEQLDASTGLAYLRARYLDTDLGRFTQVDPSGWEANPYLYAGANPATYVDPSGLFPPGTPPSPADREAWEAWMRDVALPWLYGVYTRHNWEYNLPGADFATVARAYERGEAAARQNPIDRPSIVAQAIVDAIPFPGASHLSADQQRRLAFPSVREQLHEKNLLLTAMVDDYALKLDQWIDAFTWAGVLRFMPVCAPAQSREEQLEPLDLGRRPTGERPHGFRSSAVREVADSNIAKYGVLTCEHCGQPIQGSPDMDHYPTSWAMRPLYWLWNRLKELNWYNDPDNLVISCPHCNRSAGARWPE